MLLEEELQLIVFVVVLLLVVKPSVVSVFALWVECLLREGKHTPAVEAFGEIRAGVDLAGGV